MTKKNSMVFLKKRKLFNLISSNVDVFSDASACCVIEFSVVFFQLINVISDSVFFKGKKLSGWLFSHLSALSVDYAFHVQI